MTFPEAAGFNAKRETSRAAAAMMDATGKRQKQTEFLADKLRAAGPDGIIAEEAKQYLLQGGYKNIERSHASARLSDLCAQGKDKKPSIAIATDRRRYSEKSNQPQMIIVHRDHASAEDHASVNNNKAPRVAKDDTRIAAVHDLAVYMARLINGKTDKAGFIKVEITPMELISLKKSQEQAGIL